MIASAISQVSYNGDGNLARQFSIDFPLAESSLLVAIRTDANGGKVTLPSNQYTFTPATTGGRITGGFVTCNPAIASGSQILFKRVTPRTQTLDFTAGGSFQAESLESGLDKIVMILQEIERDYQAADIALA